MAIFKAATSRALPRPKQMPKRGSKKLNFNNAVSQEAEETIIVDTPSDASLQSPYHRRRYMRRGSRAPSMFLLSSLPSFDIACGQDDENNNLGNTGQQHFERRMSIMSLLGHHLEMKAVVETHSHSQQPNETTTTPICPTLQRKPSVPTNE